MPYLGKPSSYGLENHGLRNPKNIYWNLPTAVLVEEAIQRNEAVLASRGAIIALTGEHTGRSPNDKYVVRYTDDNSPIWWGKINQPISPENYDRRLLKMKRYFEGKDVVVQDM